MISIAVLALALHAQPAVPQPSTGNAAIVGIAVNAVTGKPVPGALINIWRDPHVPSLPSAITQDDGSFLLTGLPSGAYRLSISKPGFLSGGYGRERPSGEPQVLKITETPEPTRITMKTWPAASIEGRIFDDAGHPVAGLMVRTLRRMDLSAVSAYDLAGNTAMTNDLGEYRISGLSPGDYVPVVGCSAQTRNLGAPAAPRGPTAGRGMLPMPSYDGALRHLIDRDGRLVSIPSCPPAHSQVFATSLPGGRSSLRETTPVTLSAGETRPNVDVHLRALPAYRVSGTIATPNGPVEGGVLKLVPEEWDGPPHLAEFMTTAAASGDFTFLAVPSGRYKLTANRRMPPLSKASVTATGGVTMPMDDVIYGDKENLSLKTSLVVGSADVTNLALVLTSGTRVTGTVRFEGSGPPPLVAGRMSPLFEPLGDRLAMVPGTIGIDGRFTLNLAPGNYLIDISRGSVPAWTYKGATVGGREIGGHPLEVGTEEITDLVLMFTDRIASLSGSVSGMKGAAAVVVFPADRNEWTSASRAAGRRAPWRSDLQPVHDGKYAFPRLLPGDYFVVAVDDAALEGWPSTSVLEPLSRHAERITLLEGDQRVLNLPVRR